MSKVIFGDVVRRANTKEDRHNTDKIYYVGGEHIESNEVLIENRGLIEGSTIGPMFYFGFKAGDILFVSRNPHLRKSGMVTFDGICSEKTFVLETKDESVLLQRYLAFVMQSDHFWSYMEAHKSGSVNFFINWSALAKYEFELPDIDKQKSLSDVLWAVSDAKNAYKKLIIKADCYLNSQFLEMFANETNCQKLGECAFIEKGKTITREEVQEGNIPVVAAGIQPSCYHNKSNRDAGIITVSASGANAGYVNYWNIPIFASDCNTVRAKDKDKLDNVFLYCRLKVIQDEIFKMQKGAGQPHVYAKDIADISVPIPTIEMQRKYSKIVDCGEKSKRELQQAIINLTNIEKSILAENFN